MVAAVASESERRSEAVAATPAEAVRARWLAEIPRWYSPWGHLAFPAVVGIGIIAASIALLRDVHAWQLGMVPLVLVLSNAVEWRVHKNVLHRRMWPLEMIYEQHTPNHHRVYVTDDMVIRSSRELRFVLLPFWAVVAILVLTAPITGALFLAGQHNLAALFVATSTAYVLSYEWLHLAYHLPPSSLPGRLVGGLRNHHAKHHDPALMQKWNFNVTVPLWDWVRGTIYPRSGGSKSA